MLFFFHYLRISNALSKSIFLVLFPVLFPPSPLYLSHSAFNSLSDFESAFITFCILPAVCVSGWVCVCLCILKSCILIWWILLTEVHSNSFICSHHVFFSCLNVTKWNMCKFSGACFIAVLSLDELKLLPLSRFAFFSFCRTCIIKFCYYYCFLCSGLS